MSSTAIDIGADNWRAVGPKYGFLLNASRQRIQKHCAFLPNRKPREDSQ